MIAKSTTLNSLSTNITKWSNTLKQFVGKLLTNCLSVFDHFVGLALKGLSTAIHPKLCENCAIQQNFHSRKLGEISVVFFSMNIIYTIKK